MMEEITGRLPDQFNMSELFAKAQERSPYEVVALQECERMNFLIREIRSSLRELSLGLKVSVLWTLIMELTFVNLDIFSCRLFHFEPNFVSGTGTFFMK